ncbi:MAG: radical SAM protein [Oscillospiraceae bacterium]|nr:radical SAM protein [Oscillospiraceae bacterium]
MIKQISGDVVFVSGAVNSAVYDFRTKKVYSLNDKGTEIIKAYIEDKTLNDEGREYINNVIGLLDIPDIFLVDYCPQVIPENRLSIAWLELTQKCNCKCLHCYEGSEHRDTNVLSYEQWLGVIDELSELKCRSIVFIGGEPSLYKKLPELLRYAAEKNFEKICVYSNLCYISEELLEAICSSGATVRFSIYGNDAVSHDRITGIDGSFSRLIGNIEKLQKNNVKLGASIVIMRENEDRAESITELLKQMNIEHIHRDEIRKVYNGTQDEHLVLNSRMERKTPNFSADKKFFDSVFSINTCWHGKIAVSTDGKVFPCEFERNIVYGDVNKTSLKQIVDGKELYYYWHLDYSNIEVCRSCEYRFACKDCRPLGCAENGNILGKSYRCKYDPYTGVWNK